MTPSPPAAVLPEHTVGYLGPQGTFCEEALRSERDLREAKARPFASIPDVLVAVESGEVDVGLVPIENAIEGSVNVTLDALSFETDLRIRREIVIRVRLDLFAREVMPELQRLPHPYERLGLPDEAPDDAALAGVSASSWVPTD